MPLSQSASGHLPDGSVGDEFGSRLNPGTGARFDGVDGRLVHPPPGQSIVAPYGVFESTTQFVPSVAGRHGPMVTPPWPGGHGAVRLGASQPTMPRLMFPGAFGPPPMLSSASSLTSSLRPAGAAPWRAGPPGHMAGSALAPAHSAPPGFLPPPPGPPPQLPWSPPGVPPGLGGGTVPPGLGGGTFNNTPRPPVAAGGALVRVLNMRGVSGASPSVDPQHLPRPNMTSSQQQLSDVAAPPLFDNASCSADFMRLTVSAIPRTATLKARWPLPLGAVVQPMGADTAGRCVPLVAQSAAGIVRCKRCRTYMNPFMRWLEGGHRFQCNFCGLANEVSSEYFSPLDERGMRLDVSARPETALGSVEYVATKEYMVRPPVPPVYLLLIDVSSAAVSSGSLATVAHTLRDCVAELPGGDRTLVGVITFDSTIHFHPFQPGVGAPQVLVVSDVSSPFLPLPYGLLVNLRQHLPALTHLLDSLPTLYAAAGSAPGDCAPGPAMQAAYLLMHSLGGKVLLFQSAVPSVGVGQHEDRQDAALYNTEHEARLRCPQDTFFKQLAADCSRAQITVDLFLLAGHQSVDVASWAALPRATGGEVFHYPAFSTLRDGVRVHYEVRHHLLRPCGWEAVLRVRCSRGLVVTACHGHFLNRSTDLLALPTCHPGQAFAVQLAHEADTTLEGARAFVQCSLLYTHANGGRRIQVHTLCVPVVNELSLLFQAADSAALACVMAKVAVEKMLTSRLDHIRHAVQGKVSDALREFRAMTAAAPRAPHELVLPTTLQFLPYWCLGLTKCAALRGGAKDVAADERLAVSHALMAAPLCELLRMLCPDLYVLHDPTAPEGRQDTADAQVCLPPCVALARSQLAEHGAYLLDNGRVFIMWLGRNISLQWLQEIFGTEPSTLPLDDSALAVEPERPTAMSRRVNAVITTLRSGRALHQPCVVVRQGSPHEAALAPYLVEDRSHTSPSYADFMAALHTDVMTDKPRTPPGTDLSKGAYQGKSHYSIRRY